jgi:hypothetical protein
VSEIERHGHPKKEVAPRHIPSEIVPVPVAEVPEFVQSAVRGTILANPIAGAIAGWALFQPHLRFTAVDESHTRIELDVVGVANGVDVLFYQQRRAEIHRFFVALEDELDRRKRWRPHLTSPPGDHPIKPLGQ